MELPPVQYTTTGDGVRIAHTMQGVGPPIVIAPGMSVTLEMPLADEQFSRSYLDFWRRLSDQFTVVRYDGRGFGLSQREVGAVSVDTMVADLTAVIGATGAGSLLLVGQSQGGQAAIRYTASNPGRVRRLVLLGAFAAFNDREKATARAMADLWRANWGIASETTTRLFYRDPDRRPDDAEQLALRQRLTGDREAVAQILLSNAESDVSDDLARIQGPALVIHSRDDRLVGFRHARELAAAMSHAELVPFRGDHADWCMGELADQYGELLRRFFRDAGDGKLATSRLSRRETEVLTLVATGLGNAEIAERLTVSDRTVERHVQNIYTKLGAKNRVEAANWAREHGVL